MPRLRLLAILIPVAVLAWGYWHQATHAVLHVSLFRAGAIPLEGEVELLDAAGLTLARGAIARPYGTIWIAHPQAGDCTSPGRTDWPDCFQTTARWIPTWAPRIRQASVTLPNCRIDKIPVAITASGNDWWLWWVPLPHIGGTPYGSFSVSIDLDAACCPAP